MTEPTDNPEYGLEQTDNRTRPEDGPDADAVSQDPALDLSTGDEP